MTQTAITQFTNDQLSIVRSTVAKDTTPDQFKLFIEVCRYHGLSPLARQIYAVVRNSKRSDGSYEKQMTIQTSIDGYRLLAERSGKYAGQLGPEWCGEDGVWKDVWLKDTPPVAARVGVLRKDFAQPTWGVAKYKSYVQPQSPLWTKMADVLLAKCAESLALRKSFPAEMSGIYTAEEMQQADSDTLPTVDHGQHRVTVTPVNEEGLATPAQIASIHKLYERIGRTEPADIAMMSVEDAARLIELLSDEYRAMKQMPAPTEQGAQTATNKPTSPDTQKPAETGDLITEQQIASVRKISLHLLKPEPAGLEKLSQEQAKTLLAQLSNDYRAARNKAAQVAQPVG